MTTEYTEADKQVTAVAEKPEDAQNLEAQKLPALDGAGHSLEDLEKKEDDAKSPANLAPRKMLMKPSLDKDGSSNDILEEHWEADPDEPQFNNSYTPNSRPEEESPPGMETPESLFCTATPGYDDIELEQESLEELDVGATIMAPPKMIMQRTGPDSPPDDDLSDCEEILINDEDPEGITTNISKLNIDKKVS